MTTAMLCNQLRKPSQSFSEPIFTKKVNNIQVEPKYPGVIISRKVSVFSQSFSLLCFRKLHGPQQIFVLIPTKIPKKTLILSFAPKISNTEIISLYQPSLSPQTRRTTRPRSERNEIRRGTWKSAKGKKYSITPFIDREHLESRVGNGGVEEALQDVKSDLWKISSV